MTTKVQEIKLKAFVNTDPLLADLQKRKRILDHAGNMTPKQMADGWEKLAKEYEAAGALANTAYCRAKAKYYATEPA